MSRRDQIIQAVITKFKENNISASISLTSIAQEVNIGKSTIYEYFSSKEDLFKAALFTFLEETVEKVTLDEDISEYTFEEVFKKQMKQLLEAASQTRLIIESLQPRFISQFSDESRDEMKLTMEGIRDKIRARFIVFFEKGINEGIVTPSIDITDGYIVTSLVVGTIITYTDPNMTIEIDIIVNKLYDSIIKLVKT